MQNSNYKRIEQYFFFLILVLSLMPVLSFQYFPTLDGPAHLYNANLINHLLWGSPEVLQEFYVFNEKIVPNWIGHVVLSISNVFLPSYLSEKLLLLIYLIGLPISFRQLILSLNPKNLFITYIIFPFSYSFPFFLGFYSFCLALVLMFIILLFWMNTKSENLTTKRYFLLFIMLVLLYFSHVFIFGITVFLIFGQIVYEYIFIILLKNDDGKIIRKDLQRKFGLALIAGFLPIIFTAYFMLHRDGTGENIYLSFNELIDNLIKIESILVIAEGPERPYTSMIFYLFVLMTFSLIYSRIRLYRKTLSENDFERKKSAWFTLFHKNDFWLLASIAMLILYFILPNVINGGGYISLRLSLMFFLFFTIWISLKKTPMFINFVVLIGILFSHFSLLKYYNEHTKSIEGLAKNCALTADYIEEGKTVYPIYTYDYWFIQHISNYLGGDKPVIILENYESIQDHFPLRWNENLATEYYRIDDFKNGMNLTWLEKNENTPVEIDYILILGSIDEVIKPEFNVIKQYVISDYKLHYKNENCELYKLK